MKRLLLVFGILITVSIFGRSMFSQSSFSATYDSGRQVKLQGSVTRIDWVTPAAFIFVDVRDTTGTVANWAVEIGNPIELERDGWKRSTLRIGDVVTIDGVPARSEARQASAKSVTRTGKRIFGPPARRAAAPAALHLDGPTDKSDWDRRQARSDTGPDRPRKFLWKPRHQRFR